MNNISRVFIFLGIFIATVASLLGADALERLVPEFRSYAAVVTGIFFGLTLFKGILIISKQNRILLPSDFLSFDNALKGFAYSGIVFAISLTLLVITQQLRLTPSPLSVTVLIEQMLFQVRPALIEEVGFRFGLVFLGHAFFGRNIALLAGSLPFGVLHLLNFMSGQEVMWEYIIGTAIAGLYLSLIFLSYGFVAAIVAHYSWNVLAATSSHHFSFKQEQLEGGVATLITLLVTSLFLLRRLLTEKQIFGYKV